MLVANLLGVSDVHTKHDKHTHTHTNLHATPANKLVFRKNIGDRLIME
jgi:hypothetical protein